MPVALKKVPGIGAGPNCNRKEKEKEKERDGSERESRKRDILVIRNYSFPEKSQGHKIEEEKE